MYCFARQSKPQWANALKTGCPFLEEVVRRFIVMAQRGHDQLMDNLLTGGEVIGIHHLQPSGSIQSGVYLLVGSIQLNSSSWWAFQCLQNSFKILFLEGELGLSPRAALLFLDCVSLVSASHSFSNYQQFDLPFVTSLRLSW